VQVPTVLPRCLLSLTGLELPQYLQWEQEVERAGRSCGWLVCVCARSSCAPRPRVPFATISSISRKLPGSMRHTSSPPAVVDNSLSRPMGIPVLGDGGKANCSLKLWKETRTRPAKLLTHDLRYRGSDVSCNLLRILPR
jgi:hypothetical protein